MHIYTLDNVALESWPDPIDTIVRVLGLRRLLTVNYDLELERYFRRHLRFNIQSDEERPDTGDAFLIEDEQDRDVFFNSTGSRLVRAEMQRTSASELLDFAIPHDEDVHLYYLHGRANFPSRIERNSLILSEGDYQRHYLENNLVRRGFDESLRALFAANTVIFLGIGMNEVDLLRPLRQFVSDDQKWRRTSGGPIVILNSMTESMQGRNDESRAAELNVTFGAKAIFYSPEISVDGTDRRPDRLQRLTDHDIDELLEAVISKVKLIEDGDAAAARKALGRIDQDVIETVAAVARRFFNFENLALKLQSKDLHTLWLAYGFLDRLKTYLVSRSMDALLQDIDPRRDEWLLDWRRLPHQRIARFGDWSEHSLETDQIRRCLWIRQRIVHGHTNSAEATDSFHYRQLQSVLHGPDWVGQFLECSASPSQSHIGRRILRVFGPRGVGKGALIHAIQLGYAQLFDGSGTPGLYAGAFFADARYSTEFNSVTTALARFIAGRVAQADVPLERGLDEDTLRRASQAEIGVFGDGTQARHTDLGYCFDEIAKHLRRFRDTVSSPQADRDGAGSRLFICLNGIERLFKYNGQAYNAIHGAFFRRLLRGDLADVPVDIVLIVGGDQPGQYRDLQPVDARGQDPGADAWWTMNPLALSKRPWIAKDLKTDIDAWSLFSRLFGLDPAHSNRWNESRTRWASFHDSLLRNTCIHLWFLHLLETLVEKRDPKVRTEEDKCRLFDRFEAAAAHGDGAVIEEIMECYRAFDQPRSLGKPAVEVPADQAVHDEILRHLAFFSVPVERCVLASCPGIRELARRSLLHQGKLSPEEELTERRVAEWLQGYLDTLFNRRMVIRLYPSRPRTSGKPVDKVWYQKYQPPPIEHLRYYLHSRMREHVSRQMNFDLFEFGEHSYFNLSLYAAQPRDLPSPKSHDYKFVGDVLHNLIRLSRMDFHPFFDRSADGDELPASREAERQAQLKAMDTPLSPSRRIRAAQSLLAGSFSIGVITRFDNPRGILETTWESDKPFESYDAWLRALANAANAVDVTERAYCSSIAKTDLPDKSLDWSKVDAATRPLYPNEVAWLFNERGLCKLVEGRLNESLTLFKQAEDVLVPLRWTEWDPDEATLASQRIARLNMAIAQIESGMAVDARATLEHMAQREVKAEQQPIVLTPVIAQGYLGLIHHLQGQIEAADNSYVGVIDKLRQYNVPRATAIFMKHRADLHRGLGRFDLAKRLARGAIYEANSTRQMDIFHLSRISLARIEYGESKSEARAASALLADAQTYADRLGIPKIQVEVDTFRSQMLIDSGDLDAAGDCLVRAIAISSRFGMNLRKISAVNNYIELAHARGDRKLVKRMRRKLTDLTEQFNYQLHNNETHTGPINPDIYGLP